MKMLINFFTILSLGLGSVAVSAETQQDKVTSLLYVCGMTFKASGRSASIILGYTYFKGEGELSCYDAVTGEKQRIPIKVTLKGPAAGLSYQRVEVSAKVLGIGLRRSPESLLGHYLAVRESAAVGVGIGATQSIRVAKDAVVLNLSVQGIKGIGAQIDILSLNIQARDDDYDDLQEAREKANERNKRNGDTIAQATALEVVRVKENQPIQIVDDEGRVLKTISVKVDRQKNYNHE